MTSFVVRKMINGRTLELKLVPVVRKVIARGVLKLVRVQVVCPACGQQVEAIATDGRVKGYCAVAEQHVDFLIEENPGHPLVPILTFFPISAPVASMIRLGVGSMSSWELIVSIILLVISIAGLLFLGAKVFRAFLLMYGKKPSLKEIIRGLRQA